MMQVFDTTASQRSSAPAAAPLGLSVEVKEDHNSLTFLASLPGFAKDDIKVNFSTLHLCSHSQRSHSARCTTYPSGQLPCTLCPHCDGLDLNPSAFI